MSWLLIFYIDIMDNDTMHQESGGVSSSPVGAPESAPSRSKIKPWMAIVIVVVILFVALAYYYRGLWVAVTVNGSPISRFSVIRALEKDAGKRVLESLVTEKLITDEIQEKGIVVGDDEVNAELVKIEESVAAQGGTLDAALEAQGMTREALTKDIRIRLGIAKLLGDAAPVSDSDIDAFIAENKVTIPKGEEESYKNQVRAQLKDQKFAQEAGTWIQGLQAQANISYFVHY